MTSGRRPNKALEKATDEAGETQRKDGKAERSDGTPGTGKEIRPKWRELHAKLRGQQLEGPGGFIWDSWGRDEASGGPPGAPAAGCSLRSKYF